eukprot:4911589-Prymnesium_polylepis.1
MTSHQVSQVLTLVGMAMTEQALQRHTGAGVARRAAFHERLRAERAERDKPNPITAVTSIEVYG